MHRSYTSKSDNCGRPQDVRRGAGGADLRERFGLCQIESVLVSIQGTLGANFSRSGREAAR